MWTKEDCRTFFSRVLGLDLDDAELDNIYEFLSTNTATTIPRHGSPNAAFSPNILQAFIGAATERTGLQLDHARFKKVREEILPAMHYAILLRKLGLGDFMLVSSDVPDIALVKLDPAKISPSSRHLDALPLEMMYVNDHTLSTASGSSNVEKIANAIITKKFSMRYRPETILIVTLYKNISDEDLEGVRDLLANAHNPFHHTWLCFAQDESVCVLAMLSPNFEIHRLRLEELLAYSY
jgi:hypothetical protein